MGELHQFGIDHHLARGAGFQPADRQFFSRYHLFLKGRCQSLHQFRVLRMHQPIGMAVMIRKVNTDFLRVARLDDIDQCIPLVGKFFHIPGSLDRFAHIIAGNRQLFKRLLIGMCIKNQHRPPAGR